MQMDGHMTMEEVDIALGYATKACREIYEVQKDALRRRYAVQAGAVDEDDSSDEEA